MDDIELKEAAVGYRRIKPLNPGRRAYNKVYYRKNAVRIKQKRRIRYSHEKGIERVRKRKYSAASRHPHPILNTLHKAFFDKEFKGHFANYSNRAPFKMKRYDPVFTNVRKTIERS